MSLFSKVTRGHIDATNTDTMQSPLSTRKRQYDNNDMSLTNSSNKSPRYISPMKHHHHSNNNNNDDDDDDEIMLHQYSQNTCNTEYTANGTRKYQQTSTHADNVHGNITVDELCTRIIDTQEFKRLTRLNQLGCCSEVFRCANHNRFVHSLGVMHLADKSVTSLKDKQPELGITDEDVQCVKVAALCHDLGHGPYSHVFDGVFIPKIYKDTEHSNWKHEDQSVKMLNYMLQSNKIDLKRYGLSDIDKLFIEEIITGTKDRKGRKKDKYYLYDIVNNTRSGLDVDKLDYFQRDMQHSNVSFQSGNSFERFISSGKVLQAAPIGENSRKADEVKPDWPKMICYPKKMVDSALEFFQTRFKMHNTVYTHKVVKAIEFMYTDAMFLAGPFIKIQGKKTDNNPDGKYTIAECIFDEEAYSHLDDHVITLIKNLDSNEPNVLKAKEILDRIDKRQLYKCVGKIKFQRDGNDVNGRNIFAMMEDDIKAEIIQTILSKESSEDDDNDDDGCINEVSNYGFRAISCPDIEVTDDDVVVEKWHTHHGSKQNNPVANLRFFDPKQKEEVGVHLADNKYGICLLPKTFEMFAVRVFVKNRDKINVIQRKFNAWCRLRNESPIQFASSQPTMDEDFADRFESSQTSTNNQ